MYVAGKLNFYMRLFTLFIFSLLTVHCFGQINNLLFKQLVSTTGLPLNSTNAILKDNHGFMWFGTSNGLIRFDGYEYKIFTSDVNDTTTISSNLVQCIVQEDDSIIWVGTEYGLNKLNIKTE